MNNETFTQDILTLIRREIAGDNPLLGERLAPAEAPTPRTGFSTLFGAAASIGEETAKLYCAGLEYIFEGYILHAGGHRLLAGRDDDFNLLAGDYMYARGLSHIAVLEDLAAIRILADQVSICSYVQCERLTPAAALEAWSAATLCLAAQSAGSADGAELADRMEQLKRDTWRGSPGAGALVEDLLTLFPDDTTGELRGIMDNIYSGFNHSQPISNNRRGI